VKYRTDVTFGWLDLLVSFGGKLYFSFFFFFKSFHFNFLKGIAGLFLGCSILSGIEIVYYFLIIGFMISKKLKTRFESFLDAYSNQARVNESQRVHKKFHKKVENVRGIKIQSLNEIDNNLKRQIQIKNRTRY
jgi:hypothetical protein